MKDVNYFRELCAELVDLDQAEPGDYLHWRQSWNDVIRRARAALAEGAGARPEPMQHALRCIDEYSDALKALAEGAGVGPTTQELRDLWRACNSPSVFARAVLERWGTTHHRPIPADEWSEDDGDVLWWRLPVEEPPYVGSPLCDDWLPGYYTHFTRLQVPLIKENNE